MPIVYWNHEPALFGRWSHKKEAVIDMWTRSQLKDNAKAALQGRYWMAFLVCLVTSFLAGGSSGGISGSLTGVESGTLSSASSPSIQNALLIALPLIFGVVLLISVVSICYNVFVAAPIRVGCNGYFMENRLGPTNFTRMFSGFNKQYKNLVLTTFLKQLFIFLWSLLFLVPGIIKSYQYYFVEYIMAENPGMEWRRALDLSRTMTDGEKWNIFVLELSFLGWYLLGALACGVGVLFVSPYASATYAELYEAAREKALYNHWATPEELPGFTPHP